MKAKFLGIFFLSQSLMLLLAPAACAQEKKGQKLALLVGVRDYDHADLRPLRFSENDVVALARILEAAGYDATLLSDENGEKNPKLAPTRANIDRHLAEILAKSKRREDTILLAFAGHGIQPEGEKDAYFCPKDANPKVHPAKTMVPLSKVYAALEESFAGVKVVLVDACRDDPRLARGRSGITGDTAPRPPRGVAVLFSCAAGEVAFEHEKYKHGVFFHHVLEGMRGKARNSDGDVTFTSLADYVANAVARDVPKLIGEGAQQSPNLKADLAGRSPVLLAAKAGDTTPPPEPMPAAVFPKGAEILAQFVGEYEVTGQWLVPMRSEVRGFGTVLLERGELKENTTMELFGAKDVSSNVMGYDPTRKLYIIRGSSGIRATGSFDAATKTLTSITDEPVAALGAKLKVVSRYVSPSERRDQVYEVPAVGAERLLGDIRLRITK